MLKLLALATLFSAIGAQARTVEVSGYDISGVWPVGTGGYSYVYDGSVTMRPQGFYLYSGGGGSLNDGVVPTSNVGAMMIGTVSPKDKSITLHLSGQSVLSEINMFSESNTSGVYAGALTGATITINGVSVALTSSAWGSGCARYLCNDTFSLAGTALAGMTTDTVVLTKFRAAAGYFTMAEINVNGAIPAVPEPQTYAMMIAGIGLLGFIARRRKKAM